MFCILSNRFVSGSIDLIPGMISIFFNVQARPDTKKDVILYKNVFFIFFLFAYQPSFLGKHFSLMWYCRARDTFCGDAKPLSKIIPTMP